MLLLCLLNISSYLLNALVVSIWLELGSRLRQFLCAGKQARKSAIPLNATIFMMSYVGVEMIRSNVEEIKAVFSSLLLSVQSALELESSADNVRQFMISFFEYDFPKTMDIKELFAAVTLNRLWDYQHYSPVERLANHLLQSDQGLQDLIKTYKACLSGFYLTTKLIDYIEYQNLSADNSDEECDQPSPKLTTKQYRKIKVVLQLERKVSQLSLEYVVKLWKSFAEEYEIPSLTVVIDRIVAGSLEVTWRVPQHIADAILPRSKFFRSHGIVLVFIDDVILYDEKQMVNT